MNSRKFEAFCEMLGYLPAKAILKAVAAERRMIEHDLGNVRGTASHEDASILAVCNFLEAAAEGKPVPLPALTVEEGAVFGTMVRKLVATGKLPKSVEEHFDTTFSNLLEHAFA
jgi:hypothetical protein